MNTRFEIQNKKEGNRMKRSIAFVIVMGLVLLFLLQGCTSPGEAATFSMSVTPAEINGNAIVGQKVIYLVHIDDNKGKDPVQITAEGTNCTILISPANATDEYVEVIVIPEAASEGSNVSFEITASRGGHEETKSITFEVVPGENDREARATELRDKFIPWLVENMPELGITADTVWEGTTVSPQWLVVSHYLFISEEWEMHVAWHVMIPPYDWVRIDLRKRFEEDKPSYAFEISSIAANDQPIEIEVPDTIWR